MSIRIVRIVRLGSPRAAGEGLRIGTVRRPPRGVPRAEFSVQDWYDVWYPMLAPSAATMKLGQAAQRPEQAAAWAAFARQYQREMAQADASRSLDLLRSGAERCFPRQNRLWRASRLDM